VGTEATSPKLRTWFLRNLLEAAERELGAGTVAQLPERVPARVREHLSLERLRATAALDTLPLEEGEQALVAFEQAVGDGTGRTLERVACEMIARQLVQAVAAVRLGDLFGTVARLRAPLEHPFVDAPVLFELARTPAGFRLTIGVAARPRATRLLGHVAVGAIHAAERFARETHAAPLRLELDSIADRARIDAHFRQASTAPPAREPSSPVSRRTGAAARPSLSDEVARILDSSRADRTRSSDEPPRLSPSPLPVASDGGDAPQSVRPAKSVRPPPSEDAPPVVIPRRSSWPPSGR
jgi:hypothetical protein